jgi:subtilase family serine protease
MLDLRGKFSPRNHNAAARRRSLRNHPRLEELETRTLMSTTLISSASGGVTMHPLDILDPAITPGQAPLTPAEMRAGYAVNRVQFSDGNGGFIPGDGTGQTIAIVDALNDPTIVADIHTFDQVFGLPDPPSFTVLNQNGTPIPNQTGTPTTPRNSPHSSWSLEESLDVEWAHVMAPKANIVLFEANTASNANLATAVTSAAKASIYAGLGIPAASVISNSYGSNDTASARTADLAQDTSTYKPISDTNKISLVFSSGDSGVAEFPSTSPYVLGVGGTDMALNVSPFGVSYKSESTYNDTAVQTSTGVSNFGSSGGGISAFETIPSYQTAYGISNGSNHREAPDVSMSGDLFSGVYITDSYDFRAARGAPATTLGTVLGTSLAAPMWGGLIAVVNQGRALAGEGPIGNIQEAVYALPTSDFHDVTTGTNGLTGGNLHSAGPGYDLVTGIGSPISNKLIPDLVAFTGTAPVSFVQVVVGGGSGGSSTPADGSTDGGTDDGSDTEIDYTPFSHSTAAAILTTNSAVHDTTLATTGTIATQTLNARDLLLSASSTVTVALPSAGQLVRVDTNVDLTALPAHTTTVVEGIHGDSRAILAGSVSDTESTELSLPVELNLPEGTGTVITTAATTATTDVVVPATPAAVTATDSVSDAVFADFSAVPTLDTRVTAPVVSGTAEETHSVDLAMLAGLALALGGSWSSFGRTEDTRKNPALRG